MFGKYGLFLLVVGLECCFDFFCCVFVDLGVLDFGVFFEEFVC